MDDKELAFYIGYHDANRSGPIVRQTVEKLHQSNVSPSPDATRGRDTNFKRSV